MTITDHAPTLSTREGLFIELDVIQTEGWDSQRGQQLLDYVRNHLVRTQVRAAGLDGPAAAQAEASGWETAWEILDRPRLRDIDNPWGWIWVAVRRCIQGEIMSAMYLADARSAWRTRRALRECQINSCDPPLSLQSLMQNGWDRDAVEPVRPKLGSPLLAVVSALAREGWDPRSAHALVEAIAGTVTRHDVEASGAEGWRTLAADLGLAPWQVRRVTVVLLGGPGWPGAMERMLQEGVAVLADPAMRAALRSTTSNFLPTPILAARQATRKVSRFAS